MHLTLGGGIRDYKNKYIFASTHTHAFFYLNVDKGPSPTKFEPCASK